MATLKEGKTNACQKKLQQLQRKEQAKEEDHVKDGERSLNKI